MLPSNAGDGQRGAVATGQEQTLEDDLVEVSTSTASEVAVELDEERNVGVLGHSGLTLVTLKMLVANINTHLELT